MSNPHLAQIHALRQNARRFWAAWQAEEARLAQLDDIAFVEQANDLLHQFCPECIVELEGIAPDANELPCLVFSANGIREHFPQVQALAELAQTQRYQVRAFRSPQGSVASDFAIEIDGFHSSASDITVALDEWRMLPALTAPSIVMSSEKITPLKPSWRRSTVCSQCAEKPAGWLSIF